MADVIFTGVSRKELLGIQRLSRNLEERRTIVQLCWLSPGTGWGAPALVEV
jgi:hypothetical protein